MVRRKICIRGSGKRAKLLRSLLVKPKRNLAELFLEGIAAQRGHKKKHEKKAKKK